MAKNQQQEQKQRLIEAALRKNYGKLKKKYFK